MLNSELTGCNDQIYYMMRLNDNRTKNMGNALEFD